MYGVWRPVWFDSWVGEAMTIIAIPDIHYPFQNVKAEEECLYAIKQERPSHVVQLGDLYDQYSFSRFTRKNLGTPEEEVRAAVSSAQSLWNRVRKNSP